MVYMVCCLIWLWSPEENEYHQARRPGQVFLKRETCSAINNTRVLKTNGRTWFPFRGSCPQAFSKGGVFHAHYWQPYSFDFQTKAGTGKWKAQSPLFLYPFVIFLVKWSRGFHWRGIPKIICWTYNVKKIPQISVDNLCRTQIRGTVYKTICSF